MRPLVIFLMACVVAGSAAAHPWLPFGTVVRVTNLRNRRSVKVRVTDRGPHAKRRVIDVSTAAARELGMQRRGVARVSVKAFYEDQDGAAPSGQ